MHGSLFFQLRELKLAKFTALQREMLAMSLQANQGVELGAALQDVFDYLGEKVDQARLEAIGRRLIKENSARSSESGGEAEEARKGGGAFGKELIAWISGMHSAERLLVAVNFDVDQARRIYAEEDYLVTDTICTQFLADRWNSALVQLQAAAAPWSSGKKGGAADEVYDLSQAGDDDPQWAQLAACFGGAR